MFKAKKRNPKQRRTFRKKGEDDEDDADRTQEDDGGGAAESIARIKKKRKLLTELQYKKGTDAATLLKGRSSIDEEESVRAAAAAAATATAAVENTASSSQEGVMEQKHKQALERYVESKLADMVGDNNSNSKQQEEESKSTLAEKDNKNSKKLTKDELYKQLAQTSESMVGRATVVGEAAKKDGDVGTGGAMLVAGTGLAEVILPVEERLKAVQATQEASAGSGRNGPAGQQARNKNYYGMPTSQVPVPAGAARFQVSAADRHRHFAGNNRDNNKTDKAVESQQQQEEEEPNDQGRLGFDALRGKATTIGNAGAATNNNNNNNNQRDNRNRASDDKVYGNFLKHHRENQWRGGR